MHIVDFEKKIFFIFAMLYHGVMTHMSYFFACNFWTVRNFKNSFGKFSHICFPYNFVWNLAKHNDVMMSWRHYHDVKISIMRQNHMH